ncbi:MAG: glycosyltransferase family 2 protein [Candidatus Promineifilaceae bacterium]|nr:glycosyltransferase family 2 protein [Candidatus Promineifilaceae bacterium]
MAARNPLAGPVTCDLSIIIVSWNVRQLLAACLKSIAAGRGALKLEVIVVDSGSADGSGAMVATEFPWVRLVPLEENVGFARGNNVGIQLAEGRHILLLNPDTVVLDDSLEQMVKFLDKHASVGGVGAQLLNPDGSVQSSRRRFPTVWTGVLESTWLEALAPQRLLTHYYAADLPDGEAADVDWVTGACLMVRRTAAEQIGLLDEAYFMYSEELDWQKRMRADGWRIVYLPTAHVVHHVGKSSEQAVTQRHINFQRAKLRYFRKYHGSTVATFLRVVLLMNYVGQLLLEGAKGLLGHKRSLRWQRVRAYWDVLRSGLRPAGY